MTPDFDKAATKAMEILIENGITETPIIPLPILKNYPGVRVISFTKMADEIGITRHDLVPLFGQNMDAATFKVDVPGIDYVVVYNMRLPTDIIWRAVARELGHIVLGHDGSTRPADVRLAEALCFAHHLISPRPIIRMLQDAFPLTMNVLTATTGCSHECVDELQTIPGAKVPKELNTQVKNLFKKGIKEYILFHKAKEDRSPVVDFGTFMENYEEG